MNHKKIGFLTYHFANNYGAVLQAYALQEFFKEKGYNVEFIDYRSEAVEDRHRIFPYKKFQKSSFIEKIKIIFSFFLFFFQRRRRIVVFEQFREKYLLRSKKYNDANLFGYFYDIFVIGSDQVWNPNVTNGFDNVYWGNFNSKKGSRKVTYAISSGSLDDLIDKEEFLKNTLSNFDLLSVRENSLQSFIQPLTAKNVALVVDPTLLVNKEVFDKIAVKPQLKGPYILVYSKAGKESPYDDVAMTLAQRYNAKIVDIRSCHIKNRILHPNFIYYQASVEEFLGLFKYAEATIVSSFHGTVFSLLFRKNFYSVSGQNMDRIQTLLRKVGLEKRIVKNATELDYTPINYELVQHNLDTERVIAEEYITSVINL